MGFTKMSSLCISDDKTRESQSCLSLRREKNPIITVKENINRRQAMMYNNQFLLILRIELKDILCLIVQSWLVMPLRSNQYFQRFLMNSRAINHERID